MQRLALALKRANKTIGLVPTMGALHEGHASLIRACRRHNDAVIVSIFVNPLQFGPSEDFTRYPRPISQDIDICRGLKVDHIFHPGPDEMYPAGFKTYVEVQELGDNLCGALRQGHFRGVTTVVNKLFSICMPDSAYFGQKDAQQALIIQRMARDLNIPVRIRVMPTVREKSGLALSSRNAYLDQREASDALVLAQSLKIASEMCMRKERNARRIIEKMKAKILSVNPSKIDYISIVDMQHLKPVEKIKAPCLVAVAVWFGKTRLIDNTVLRP